MRWFTTVPLISYATIVLAQSSGSGSVDGIPACAVSCFIQAINASGCSLENTQCQCTTGRQTIINNVTACVPGAGCSLSELAEVQSAATNICNSAQGSSTNNTALVAAAATATRTSSSQSSSTSTAAANMLDVRSTGAVVGLAGFLAFLIV